MPHERRTLPLLQRERTYCPQLSEISSSKSKIGEGFSSWVQDQLCRFEKIVCSPQGNAIWSEDCVDLTHIANFIRFNASALSNPDSLFITLSLPTYSLSTQTLIDSGSSHCFIDSTFVSDNNILTTSVPPIGLRLFDGTCNSIISQEVELPVTFPSGETFNLTFYITPLDSSCSSVLGYNWLKQYNLLIDWFSGLISFYSVDHRGLALSTDPPKSFLVNKPSDPIPDPIPDSIPNSPPITTPQISLVNAHAYMRTAKLPGSVSFQLQLSPEGILGKATSVDPPDLSSIPEDYHESADTLPPHHSYDLKIEIDSTPPLNCMYSLSQSELETLRSFINEHVNLSFIQPSKSPHSAPILFIKKKDGHLQLCVDYHGLNWITKKDHYPLPLLSDLLDALKKAHMFTKIDLHHAYHLVQITEGEEWKTTFYTHYGSFEWPVMPFGLTNAPATFQRFINDIFSDLLDVCVIIYLDNILIYLGLRASSGMHESLCLVFYIFKPLDLSVILQRKKFQT